MLLEANEISYATVIHARARAGDTAKAEWWLRRMLEAWLRSKSQGWSRVAGERISTLACPCALETAFPLQIGRPGSEWRSSNWCGAWRLHAASPTTVAGRTSARAQRGLVVLRWHDAVATAPLARLVGSGVMRGSVESACNSTLPHGALLVGSPNGRVGRACSEERSRLHPNAPPLQRRGAR